MVSREQYLGLVQISSGAKIYATPAFFRYRSGVYLARQVYLSLAGGGVAESKNRSWATNPDIGTNAVFHKTDVSPPPPKRLPFQLNTTLLKTEPTIRATCKGFEGGGLFWASCQ